MARLVSGSRSAEPTGIRSGSSRPAPMGIIGGGLLVSGEDQAHCAAMKNMTAQPILQNEFRIKPALPLLQCCRGFFRR